MRYYIMNKDTKVLFFIPSNSSNFSIEIMGVYNESLVPRSIKSDEDIRPWLLKRLAVINRRDLFSKFQKRDIEVLEELTELTHFISVNDTYWVKHDGTDIQWSDISPYTNDLFKHIEIVKEPQYNSRYWHKFNNDLLLYKYGYNTLNEENNGCSPIAEHDASELGLYLGINAVKYDIVVSDSIVYTCCKNICSENIGMITVYELFNKKVEIKELFDSDFEEDKVISRYKLIDMIILDFLTLNIDRNMTNIGVLFDTDTNALMGLAPLFDFNMSFKLAYKNEDIFFTDKYNELIDLFKSILVLDGQYIEQLLNKASAYTFTGSHSSTANEVLKHQLDLAYSLL